MQLEELNLGADQEGYPRMQQLLKEDGETKIQIRVKRESKVYIFSLKKPNRIYVHFLLHSVTFFLPCPM